jgi:hypothetical protein
MPAASKAPPTHGRLIACLAKMGLNALATEHEEAPRDWNSRRAEMEAKSDHGKAPN